MELLAADAVWHADGGGKATAASRPVYGRDHIRKLLRNIFAQGDRGSAPRCGRSRSTAQPGAMTLDAEGRIVSVLVAEVADERCRPCARSSTRTSSAILGRRPGRSAAARR